MNDQPPLGTTNPACVDLPEIFQILSDGTDTLISDLKKIEGIRTKHYYVEIENIRGFLQTLGFIQETMAEERLQETIRNTVKALYKACANIPRSILSQISALSIDLECGIPDYLFQTLRLLGPRFRISQNEMTAWVQINKDEALFYTPDTVVTALKQRGILKGLDETQVHELFAHSRFDEEICIAKGKLPVRGQEGTIQYLVQIEDLGRTPKVLESGRVSFKDIKLYEYLNAGTPFAKKIPPTPGIPGYTITNRFIVPPEVYEAEFPDLKNVVVSEDGSQLLVTEDCCITKKNGQFVLEPSLRIAGSVSYETGNIRSQVSVVVNKDVLSGFSIQSEKDILIQGLVEGAQLESKGNILIKGGIQGRDKAVIESNGDITARFITQATVTSIGNILVESEIMNAKIWAGGRVIASGNPGLIVGGQIDADADIITNSIGSEMGVKTQIRLGGRVQDVSNLITENQEKMVQQEEAVDKCLQVIELLQQRMDMTPTPSAKLQKAHERARDMLHQARMNLDDIHHEIDHLQQQYEEGLNLSRTVRARKTIYPGTVIDIQGVELVIKKPTGPVTVVKQGDELVLFPFKDIETH